MNPPSMPRRTAPVKKTGQEVKPNYPMLTLDSADNFEQLKALIAYKRKAIQSENAEKISFQEKS